MALDKNLSSIDRLQCWWSIEKHRNYQWLLYIPRIFGWASFWSHSIFTFYFFGIVTFSHFNAQWKCSWFVPVAMFEIFAVVTVATELYSERIENDIAESKQFSMYIKMAALRWVCDNKISHKWHFWGAHPIIIWGRWKCACIIIGNANGGRKKRPMCIKSH